MLNDGCSLSVLTRHVACPIISLTSKVVEVKCKLFQSEFDLVSYACPEVLVSQSTNSKNSSRITPDWSTNLIIRVVVLC